MAKTKAMSKSTLISHLAEKNEMTRKQVVAFMDTLVTTAYKEAKNGFTLPGVGKLVLVKRKARMGRNPATGETIKIPAKKVVKFRIAKAAKDAILPTGK
ncbi:MAG: HU family DNA-binding protein [Planctomycetota bacterium]